MYGNYNKTRKKVNEYEKLSSQTRGGYTAYDKGKAGLTTTETQAKAPTPPLRKNNDYSGGSPLGFGALAKSNLNSALQELYPDNKYKGLFDGIEDSAVEKNLSLADDVITKNSANPYNKSLFPKLPNLRGGLATYYAAAESGKYKAADMARKLAYTEGRNEGLLSGGSDVSPKIQTSNKRYVNDPIGLKIRELPGTNSNQIGSLKFKDEVEFTGNKTSKIGKHEWAEIKYGDKTGWVAADYLNTEMPYDRYVPSRTDNTESKMPQQEKSNAQTTNKGAGTRYIGEKTISMRAVPGLRGHTKTTIEYGQSVEYTGNKKTLDGIAWAEVKHGNKTGWVIADYLKTQRSPDMPYGVDLTDHDGFQKAFDEITEGFTADRLQCVFLTKWFLNNYTTLKTGNGDGFIQVEATRKANPDKHLQESIIPSAPAIYSMAKESPGFGMRNLTDRYSGHTGVILSVKSNNESENPLECTYNIVFFDTYSGLLNDKHRSRLRLEQGVKPVDHITYLNVGNYLK